MKKFVDLLRMLILQGKMLIGVGGESFTIILGTNSKREIRVEVVSKNTKGFTFHVEETVAHITKGLAGRHDAKFVASMIRVEIALWLQNQFLLLPPKFSLSKPENQKVHAQLI